MLWDPNNKQKFVFQGEDEAIRGCDIADLYIPIPSLLVLASGGLDEWCAGGWQNLPHGCICKRTNGECQPDSNPFQSITVGEENNKGVVSRTKFIRLIAPSARWVIMLQFIICADALSRKLWLEEFAIEFRMGDIFPEYLDLETNGCLSR